MNNNREKNTELSSLKDVTSFAHDIIKEYSDKKLICLYGELGSGKTAICKEIIKVLTGVDSVTSPTFNIVQIYEGNGQIVNHYDLYRLKSIEEIFEIGLLENQEEAYCLIEWPEIAEKFLPKDRLNIKIVQTKHNIRKVKSFISLLL